ncbi:hypothetical protein [Paenibacillus humicus]|uniref:hypothetical protein n=1 Tax=Paenibacillus humicus TaxID=412861 RepID=UPI000FDC99A9|nr:hypothetical protein [Paenibacillus humicus]
MLLTLSLLVFYIMVSFGYGSLIDIITSRNGSTSKSNWILIYPFFGVVLCISIAQSIGAFTGVQMYSYLIILIGFLLLFRMLRSKLFSVYDELRENALTYRTFIGFFFVIFIVYMYLYPSLYAGFPTSFASINNDLIFYLSIPEFLQRYSYFHEAVSDNLHPFYSIAELHFSRNSRVGADYFNTLGMNFFQVNALSTFNVISCFFVLLVPLSAYYTAFYCFELTKRIAVIFTILVSVNSLLYWMFTTQYMPQIAGNAFFILCIGISYQAITKRKPGFTVMAGLVFSGLISVYSEYMLYYLLPMGLFVIIQSIIYKQIWIYIKTVALLLLSTIIINPVSFYIALKYNYFAFTSTQNQTGIVDYIPYINQILMMFGAKTLDYSHPSIQYTLSAILLIIITIYGLLKLKKNVKLIMVILTIFYMALFVYLSTLNQFPYGYYKTMMFAFPFVILLFANGISEVLDKKIWRYGGGAVLIILVCSNLIQWKNLSSIIVKEGTVVTKEYRQLGEIASLISDRRPLLVKELDMNQQHIVATLLKDKPIFFEGDPSYFKTSKNENYDFKYVLSPVQGGDIIADNSSKEVWSNEIFKLNELNPSSAQIHLEQGWYNLEDWGGIPSRWTEKNFTMSVSTKQPSQKKLSFDLILPPGNPVRTLNIKINDQNLQIEVPKNGSYTTGFMKLESGLNQISFEIIQDSVRIDGDSREFGIGIQNVQLLSS